MIHALASIFFAVVLVGSLVALDLTVRRYWPLIQAALRGELGGPRL